MRYRRILDDNWETRGQRMRDAIEDGRPFRIGAKKLTGRPITSADADHLGELPEPHRTRTHEGIVSGSIDFAIFSYETPIAIRMINGEWIMPNVTYSLTTGQHQGALNALHPRVDGPHISLMKGYNHRGRYGSRRGGIDDPYGRPTRRPDTAVDDMYDETGNIPSHLCETPASDYYGSFEYDEETVLPELAYAWDAMDSAEAELKHWRFDATGIPIID